jgi:hypothetical protein
MIPSYICFSFGLSVLRIVQASSHKSRGLSSFLLVTLTEEIVEATGRKVALLGVTDMASFLSVPAVVTLTPEIETTGCKVELLVAIEIVSFLSVAAAEVDGDGEVVDVFFLSEARRPLKRDLKPITAESCVDLDPVPGT